MECPRRQAHDSIPADHRGRPGLCSRRGRVCAQYLSDRDDPLRSGAKLERVHGALAPRDAGRDRHRYDVGPNRWFDAGDRRFAPDNILISSRQASLLAIVARNGSVVWRLGPDSGGSKALLAIGPMIGQHDARLIPEGLPGAGDLLVFDNDGKIVWEYVYPRFSGARSSNAVYRAYRVPYSWIPQLPHPKEQSVVPPALGEFRVPQNPAGR